MKSMPAHFFVLLCKLFFSEFRKLKGFHFTLKNTHYSLSVITYLFYITIKVISFLQEKHYVLIYVMLSHFNSKIQYTKNSIENFNIFFSICCHFNHKLYIK